MRRSAVRHLLARSQQSFWLVPTGCVVLAVILAFGLPQADVHADLHVLFPGGPESARSFLSSITTAMISVTGLVFSITIVALQLAAGQFSSRVMRDFLRDRVIQSTFGVFVGTFAYTMVLARSVRGVSGGSDVFVPQLAVTAAFVLVLGSVAVFIIYINHIANAIRVANIVDRIGAHGHTALNAVPSPPDNAGDLHAPTGSPNRVVACPRGKVVVSINEEALVRCAASTDAVFALVPRIGDFVPEGAPLFTLHGDGPCDDELLQSVAFDTERSYEQDIGFAFRALVDIAERALSPGTNDPTTAAQAIDVLHDLLRTVATRPPPPWHRVDESGALRLVVPTYDFAELLQLAVQEIAHYGAEDIQTPRRLTQMLRDLHTVALPSYQTAIERWRDVVSRGAE